MRNVRNIFSQLVNAPPPTATKKKTDKFAKLESYSESKVALTQQVERQGTVLQQLRQKPDGSITLPETVRFSSFCYPVLSWLIHSDRCSSCGL